jgi:hypothetical protein
MSAKKPAPMPTDKARVVEGHTCEFCGKTMYRISTDRMYCKDVGQGCEAKNRLFKIGYKGD